MENFINYPAVRFKKTNISHEELYKVFCEREQEGVVWRNNFMNALAEGNDELLEELTKDTDVTFLNYTIDMMLNLFSLNQDYSVMFEILKQNQEMGNFIQDIKINESTVSIQTEKGNVFATKLSTAVPDIKKYFPEIDSEKRYGECHRASIAFAKQTNLKCRVATGYVAPLSDKNSYLHSWVEFCLCGDDVVLDFTRGMMYDKSSYYMLRNINGPVYKISSETIKREEPIIRYLAKKDPYLSKLYLANRQEAIAIYTKMKFKDLISSLQKNN